jgi:acylglycerol lipase
MNSFELSWKTFDGLGIFGRVWEPVQRKAKAVVCLVHGLGEHSGRYVHVADVFSRSGYAMVSFDLRGHGRSGGPRGHTPSIEAYMKDIDVLMAQARARFPGLPMFLYGHSLGGILVLNYGLRRRPDVKGIISTGPALHSALEKQTMLVTVVKLLGGLLPRLATPSGLDAQMISHDHEIVDKYIHDPLVHDKTTLGFGKVMLEATRWTLAHAGEFPVPLLLVHGKEDKIAYPSSSIDFAAPLKDRVTLMLWDGLYHEVHNEPEKNEVLNAMVIWMDARLA